MHKRLSQKEFYTAAQPMVEGLKALGNFSGSSTLSKSVLHLVKLRVSQVNGCAFCLHMHANEARSAGESQERLDVLAAWQETAMFTQPEQVALKLAEAVTNISQAHITDALYAEAIEEFGQEGVIALLAAIVEINSWNRVSITMQFQPITKEK